MEAVGSKHITILVVTASVRTAAVEREVATSVTEESRLDSILHLVLANPRMPRVRDIPLRFVEEGDRAFVLAPGDPVPAWVHRIRGSPAVAWRIEGEIHTGQAVPIEDPSVLEGAVAARFRERFGEVRFRRWFGPRYVGIELRPWPAGVDSVEAYFDRLAPSYDDLVAGNWLDASLRDTTRGVLVSAFRAGDRVLEIGSGTGAETLSLARSGVHVVAVDISDSMLRVLERKAADAGVSGLVGTRHLAARDLGALVAEFGPGSFQGAFSTFGALNCEERLGGIPQALSDLVAPGGSAVFAIWNRACILEMGAHALALNPRRALARTARPVPVGRSRFGVPAYPYDVGAFTRSFRPAFRAERIVALPFLLPPYDFSRRLPRTSPLVPLLTSLDARLRRHFPFNRLGDHFLVTMRRVAGVGS